VGETGAFAASFAAGAGEGGGLEALAGLAALAGFEPFAGCERFAGFATFPGFETTFAGFFGAGGAAAGAGPRIAARV